MDVEIVRKVETDKSSDTPLTPDVNTLGWWVTYEEKLAKSGFTESATTVVDLDSDYIVKNGVFGAGEAGDPRWPSTRLRRGLVMGAVQSGKTASLIGVVTKALDRGVDIVVILAGTRIALWKQTYERLLNQLDGWSEKNDSARRVQRVILPKPSLVASRDQYPDLASLYFETPNLVRRQLLNGKPLIAIAMKHSDHLIHLAKFLHRVVEDFSTRSGKPLHMLVIDDEADDGSILDSAVEAGLAPDSDALKQIPRHIARLWAGQGSPVQTINSQLFATYIAYTATPQANFLQSDHNPLSPSDFLAALRSPFDEGSVVPPRSSTYLEPAGIAGYYSGGEIFYRRLAEGDGAVCQSKPFPARIDFDSDSEFASAVIQSRNQLLSDALRSYFVSGAVRLINTDKRLSVVRTSGAIPISEMKSLLPDSHSMLFHPSARVDTHFFAAQEIAEWSAAFALPRTFSVSDEGIPELNVNGLIARLEAEEDLWKEWLVEFDRTRARLSYFPNGAIYPHIHADDWPKIKRMLIEEVFPYTRISVINSDPRADDRPHFDPLPIDEQRCIAPPDVYTIFVSGNVMSRGITIEGLSTVLFLRSANDPIADTQMQMQRWFGYRGRYLMWCRVFLFADQLDLFRGYHEADEAVRREIVGEMNANPGGGVNPLVLQGLTFRATGKISNLRALPLCPGADPFVRLVETGVHCEDNIAILADLLDTEQWSDLTVNGRVRGKSLGRRFNMLEVAELLEKFRYTDHDPDRSSDNHGRWRSLESELEVRAPEAPFYRAPGQHIPPVEKVSPTDCPYSIAAYLRFWAALLSRRARGVFPTDNRRLPWSMIDLADYAATAPEFYVGVRYGSLGTSTSPRLACHNIQAMKREVRDDILLATWGSRNPGLGTDTYLGDQLFDYHIHHHVPPLRQPGEPLWRRRGAPGLLLFHVVRVQDNKEAVTVGLALPLGGPDHIAALRPQ